MPDTSDTGARNLHWATALLSELAAHGVNYACLSPGSRCTPLTVAAAHNETIETLVHYDERGAAFHALGYARATGRPAVLISTSGTAVANYLPAVVEASVGHVPLLVITCDRPPELRQAGANQTIDQVRIFGNYTRWYFELPCPTSDIDVDMVRETAAQAVYRSDGAPAGPVHLNCLFREPFLPENADLPAVATDPKTTYYPPARSPTPEALDALEGLITDSTSRLLVAGELRQADVPAVRRLAEHLQWPLYADITSGLRLSAPPCRVTAKAAAAASPDLILHVGGKLVSKEIQNTVAACHGTVVQALNHCERQDPDCRTDLRIETDIPALCNAMLTRITQHTDSPAETASDKAVDQLLDTHAGASEASIARAIAQKIPATDALFLGNSMPIRNMDLFANTDGAAVPIGGNRGASGIDGLIASASGFAKGLQRHVTLLIGDVSCLHDLSSLALAQHHQLTIVILNNDGGGIFGHLPIAERADVFEKYFLTPHGRRFEHAAMMFELNYAHTETTENFRQAYEGALNSDASTIIEVTIERQHSMDTHRRILEL